MKNIHQLLVAIFIISGFIFAGCEDFLDKQPVSQLSRDKYWKTAKDADIWMAAMYDGMQNTLSRNWYIWGEVRSDNPELAGTGTAQLRFLTNTITADMGECNWNELYRTISSANYAIKYIPTIPDVIPQQVASQLAQAYTMRALMYFYAVRVWGPVPLITEPYEGFDGQERFNSRTEVAKIKAAKPDILFPVSRPGDSVILLRELYKQKVPLMGIFGPGSPGWYEPDFVKDMDKLAYHTLVNVPWINPSSPSYQRGNAAFQKAVGKNLDTNSAYAYTGPLVIADALERAGSTKREAILKALRETNFKDHPVVGGPVKFDEKGDNTGAMTALIQVQPDPDLQKRVKIVLPKEFAQSDKIVFPAPQLWER